MTSRPEWLHTLYHAEDLVRLHALHTDLAPHTAELVLARGALVDFALADTDQERLCVARRLRDYAARRLAAVIGWQDPSAGEVAA